MARPPHIVQVPVRAAEVRAFLEGNRTRFQDELNEVIKLIQDARGKDRRLDSIYKIYTRAERQDGNELKHPRKVRLKFDRYNITNGNTRASLFDVPDIVGATVVVSFPSHISRVASFIDDLVDSGKLFSALTPGAVAAAEAALPEAAKTVIVTRHGRPIESRGYFACHYNVKRSGPAPRPVCEIQIKTVLHDAWGAKTHDLTYKPSGRTDRTLLRSFELLGDMLANLDHQSDTLRDSIERVAGVREYKRAQVQMETLRAAASAGVSGMVSSSHTSANNVVSALAAIENIQKNGEPVEAEQVARCLLGLLEEARVAGHASLRRQACLLACYLASRTRRPEDFRWAQDAIENWDDCAENEAERLTAKSFAALAAFGAGNASEAIELGEEALAFYDGLTMGGSEQVKLKSLAFSLLSSMAYYHAERIGSHEGELGGSASKAAEFAARASNLRSELGLPENGIDSPESELQRVLDDTTLQRRAFFSLDTDCFVRIQTAANEEELRKGWEKLNLLHKLKPAGIDPLASLLFDFHEYCARVRLTELEAG